MLKRLYQPENTMATDYVEENRSMTELIFNNK